MEILTTVVHDRVQAAFDAGYTTVSAQGSSRCFAEGTLVRMFDGSLKAVEHIVVGDKVMNMKGNGYNIVTETHSGVDEMYLIHQHRGIDYVVNSKHILTLKQTRPIQKKVAIEGHKSCEKRKVTYLPYDKEIIHNFETEQYYKQSKNFKKRYTGFKQTLIQFTEKPLPIDPYYLGIWLGDGTATRASQITNSDKEIRQYFSDFAQSLGTESRNIGKYEMDFLTRGYSNGYINDKIGAFCRAFYDLNLRDNKHIPSDYIYNSYENRLKLLAGLIDTDGCRTKRNTYKFSQTKKHIVESVVELCNTTGFYTNGIRESKAKMKRHDGSIYETTQYFVEINHNDFKDLNSYMLVERKKINKQCDRNYYATQIDVIPQGKGKYYGFTLDNSPYFLLKDGTVVHNSSKTYNILIWLIIRCLNHAGTTVSIVRCSLPTIRGSVLRDMVEILTNMGIYNPKNLNNTQMIYTFNNGSYIEFFSTDNEQKIRGRKRQILYCNECNEITNYDAFVQLKIRTTLFTILDYNPSFSDEHWLNDINREAKTYHFITTYKDNPFLEQNVVDELESLQWKNPSLWQVFGLGQRAMVEGLVFNNFTVEKKLPELKKQWIGIDFGFTQDPTAIVLVGVIDDTLYIHELAYERKMLSKDIAQVVCKSKYKHLPIICDSADPRLRKEIVNVAREEFKTDIDIIPVKKGNTGSIMPSIDKMSMYKIKITETSFNVIREFKNYTYVKDREGNWINRPIDKFNHAIDAIRYVVMTKLLGGYKKRGLKITR